jgi:hypothetical protein
VDVVRQSLEHHGVDFEGFAKHSGARKRRWSRTGSRELERVLAGAGSIAMAEGRHVISHIDFLRALAGGADPQTFGLTRSQLRKMAASLPSPEDR